MKYKYYKIGYEPSDSIHLPKGAEYKSYGEERYTPGPGFRAYGEVTTDRKMTIPEEIHYGLWEMKEQR